MYCWLMSPKKGERGGRKSGPLLPETGAGAGVGVDGLDDRWMEAYDWAWGGGVDTCGCWIHLERTDCGVPSVHTLVLVVQQCVQLLQCKLSE